MSFEVDVERRFGPTRVVTRFASDAGLTALTGPSGAGKSSVLNMIAGLLRPDRGRIVVGGRTLFDADTDLPAHRRHAGYIFQDGRLFPHMRVAANLAYARRLAAERPLLDEPSVIDFLGLGHLLGRWPRSLSGGEARRVAIGRTLMSGARFLLLDEPLVSLDTERREEVMKVIERLRDELSMPILYVSHDDREVDRLAGRIVPIGAAFS